MEDVLIPAIIFSSIVAIVKILADRNTRNKLIDKGLVDEKVRNLLSMQHELSTLSNLKWGMILVAIGAAALLGRAVGFYWDGDDEAMLGLMFVCAGVAFLAYYGIAQGRLKQLDRNRQE